MPWGEPNKVVLSEADRKILADVKQACGDLMSKLGELEMYVDTLNSELGIKRMETGATSESTAKSS